MMMRLGAPPGPVLPAILLTLLALCLAAGTVRAEETIPEDSAREEARAQASAPAEETEDKRATTQANPSPTAGMVIFLDPETGRVTSTPTDAQRAQLQAMIEAEKARQEAGPAIEIIERPDGSTIAVLHGRYQELVGAFRLPDGTIVLDGRPTPTRTVDK